MRNSALASSSGSSPLRDPISQSRPFDEFEDERVRADRRYDNLRPSTGWRDLCGVRDSVMLQGSQDSLGYATTRCPVCHQGRWRVTLVSPLVPTLIPVAADTS
jgi:hypothetical protein